MTIHASLARLVNPDSTDLLSGDIGYDEAILGMMSQYNVRQKSSKIMLHNPLISAGVRRPNREHPGLKEILDEKDTLSMIELQFSTKFVSANKLYYHRSQEGSKIDSSRNLLESKSYKSLNSNYRDIRLLEEQAATDFRDDFEFLLNWQANLEAQAISEITGIDTYFPASVSRYSREETVLFVYHLVNYLRDLENFPIPKHISAKIWSIMSKIVLKR